VKVGALHRNGGVTESVAENIPPFEALRAKRGKGEMAR
jgi:hypothetical protein